MIIIIKRKSHIEVFYKETIPEAVEAASELMKKAQTEEERESILKEFLQCFSNMGETTLEAVKGLILVEYEKTK